MPVSGHVVVVQDGALEQVFNKLSSIVSIDVGDPQPGGIPIALDAETTEEEKQKIEEIRTLPGVESVSLIYYNFEDVDEEKG